MNILLIKPYAPYPYSEGDFTYNRIWPPLCLANCAALLRRQGHRADILDAHAFRLKPDKTAGQAAGYDKVFITSSALDRWQCPPLDLHWFAETVRRVKAVNGEVYVMGWHGTVAPGKMLERTHARALIRGEPEETVVDICRNGELSSVRGVSFLRGAEVVSSCDRQPLDLKVLPEPAFGLFDFNRYAYEILGERFCVFEMSRGCGFGCSFCNKDMYGAGVRAKTPEQVMREIELAVGHHAVRTGYFIDLNFLADSGLADTVVRGLIKKRYSFRWACQTRPDYIDPSRLGTMKAAGCRIIHMGIESGSAERLRDFNKSMPQAKVKETVAACRRAGIMTFGFFLLGSQLDNRDELEDVLAFSSRLDLDFVSFHQVVPYSPELVFQDAAPHPGTDRNIRRAFIKYYTRPGYLFRRAPLFAAGAGKLFRLFWGRLGTLK